MNSVETKTLDSRHIFILLPVPEPSCSGLSEPSHILAIPFPSPLESGRYSLANREAPVS